MSMPLKAINVLTLTHTKQDNGIKKIYFQFTLINVVCVH